VVGGKRHADGVRNQARELRRSGLSIEQIGARLAVPRGTVYSWAGGVKLGPKALELVARRKLFGIKQTKWYWQQKSRKEDLDRRKMVSRWLKNVPRCPELARIYAALLFWAEGSKKLSRINFSNSDPEMISYFLELLRQGFKIDETKFRVLLQLHEYHDGQERQLFWTRITKIPAQRFLKTYWKPHTGKRIRKDYPGTCDLYYYDANLAKTLTVIYKLVGRGEFTSHLKR
jgi:hypothetical protein